MNKFNLTDYDTEYLREIKSLKNDELVVNGRSPDIADLEEGENDWQASEEEPRMLTTAEEEDESSGIESLISEPDINKVIFQPGSGAADSNCMDGVRSESNPFSLAPSSLAQ